MDEMLYRVFAEAVGRYLDRLGAEPAGPPLAAEPGGWTHAPESAGRLHAAELGGPPLAAESVVRLLAVEARRLVAAWRALLALHNPVGRRCAGCAHGRAMCGVWRVANAYFVRRLPGDARGFGGLRR